MNSFRANAFYTLGFIVLVVVVMYFLKSVLVPLLFSFIFSVVLCLPTDYLIKKGLSKYVAASIIIFIVSILLGLVLFFATFQISLLVENFEEITKIFAEKGRVLLNKFQNAYPSIDTDELVKVDSGSREVVGKIGSYLSGTAGNAASILFDVMLIPLFVFFMLIYRSFFRAFLHKVIGGDPNRIDTTFDEIYDIVKSYLLGLVLVMIVVAVLNSIGLVLFNVPYPIFFAFLASILMIIPYIGVFIGSFLPVAMVFFIGGDPYDALFVALWMWGVQLLEANFITPNVVGSKVKLNPFIIIISLILFGQLWGISGLILAIPIIAILRVIFHNISSLKPYGLLLGEVS